MKKAIYAGTFDPITYGHIDVLNRAKAIFDRVIVGVSARPKITMFSQQERIALVKSVVKGRKDIEVVGFSSLLVDLARKMNAATLIRGIRAVSDFDYELQMTLMNRKLAPDIETIFLMPGEKYIFISSSLVKEIASLGGDISALVPDIVAKALLKKISNKKKP
ncbi:pantetheine-phosphate adenylyltransferase [candidate division WOR-3 bacterium RBG_13_43_14]|uniref:Phosphopantetheine adenylyltransferase n=1 Tax=candidate division WOR-3 bacterium RBG_13_43_14 TaxID=1802590 RepID=A0A1F4UB74_UNCW3|nr:MAG: pantetheine-phosphate adenylyltransferase [candidate division WOR-3 bacterium RBG_13_43_14]